MNENYKFNEDFLDLDGRKKEKVIFFLSNQQEGPPWLYQFAQFFSDLGVKLVTVTWSQYLDFLKFEKMGFLVISTTNFRNRKLYEQVVRPSLPRMLKSGKVTIFHLNSFPEDIEMRKLKRLNNYFTYFLPAEMKELASKIVGEYTRELRKDHDQAWKWGNA